LDWFHLASGIDRLPHLGYRAAYTKQRLRDKLIEHKAYILYKETAKIAPGSRNGNGPQQTLTRWTYRRHREIGLTFSTRSEGLC